MLSLLASKGILCFFLIILLPDEHSSSVTTDVFHLVSVRILLDLRNGTNGTEKQWRLTVLSFPFSSRTPSQSRLSDCFASVMDDFIMESTVDFLLPYVTSDKMRLYKSFHYLMLPEWHFRCAPFSDHVYDDTRCSILCI